MDKIKNKKLDVSCDCAEDCVYSRYTLSLSDKQILERTSTAVFFQFPGFAVLGTNEMLGNDFTKSSWYNMGNYYNFITIRASYVLYQVNMSRMLMIFFYRGNLYLIKSFPGQL